MIIYTSKNYTAVDDNELQNILQSYLSQQLHFELPNRYHVGALDLDVKTVSWSQRQLATQVGGAKEVEFNSHEFLITGKLTVGEVPSTDEIDTIVVQSFSSRGFLALLANSNDPALRSTGDIEVSISNAMHRWGGPDDVGAEWHGRDELDSLAIEKASHFEEVPDEQNSLTVIAIVLICFVALVAVFVGLQRKRLLREMSVSEVSRTVDDDIETHSSEKRDEENCSRKRGAVMSEEVEVQLNTAANELIIDPEIDVQTKEAPDDRKKNAKDDDTDSVPGSVYVLPWFKQNMNGTEATYCATSSA